MLGLLSSGLHVCQGGFWAPSHGMGLCLNAMPFLGDLSSTADLDRRPHLYLHPKPHHLHSIYSIYSYPCAHLTHWAINARTRIKLAWVTLVPTIMGTT